MKDYSNKLQSIDSRHGTVGTELHLTSSLCDARHTSASGEIAAHTYDNRHYLLKCTHASEGSKRTDKASTMATLIIKNKRKAIALATALGMIAFANQADYRGAEISFASLDPAASQQDVELQARTSAASVNGISLTQQLAFGEIIELSQLSSNTSRSNTDTAVATDLFGPTLGELTESDTDEKSSVKSPRDKMSGPVAALAGGPGVVDLIVRYDQHPEFFDDQRVAELGGEVIRSYETLDMRAIRIPAAVLEELAIDENVDWLSLDDDIQSTSVASRAAANTPATATVNAAYGGAGVGVAILDTGVTSHTDLNDNFRQYSFLTGNTPVPTVSGGTITSYNNSIRKDEFGHGTHVAGIISGSGAVSSDNYKGTATSAHFLSLQVLDKHGGGSMSNVMAALDWLLTYGSYFEIRVVNLSLGKAITESNETDPLVIAVENLWDAGMVVVVAAGNYGYHGNVTVTSPANSRKVITVGSLTDNGTGSDFSDDYVSSFSSRGPTFGDYVLKPDLVAPGNRIVATIPTGSRLALDLSERLVACHGASCGNNIYLEMSGTSMATPLVSAAVTLMLEKDPTLTPATIKARLMRSARKFDTNFIAAGAGMLDVDAAMNDLGTISGEALSPLMYEDTATNGVVVEDTAALWGDAAWGSSYLYTNGAGWADGIVWTGADGVTSSNFAWTSMDSVDASGFGWTDGGVNASGFGWTDNNVHAKGFGWTDGGAHAQSLLEEDANGATVINDD